MTRTATLMSSLFFGLAALALATPAHAEERDWYAAAGGTVTVQGTSAGTIANAPAPGLTILVDERYEPGGGGFIAFGRRIGRFRVEGEVGYTRETADRQTFRAPPAGEVFGDIRTRTLRGMANGFVDFKLAGLEPYIGAGVGYAGTDLRVIGPRAIFPTEQPRRLIDDRDRGFAYQAMAGIALPVNDRLRFTLGYRWFDEGRFTGVDGRGEEVTRTRGGHNIDAGLRWSF